MHSGRPTTGSGHSTEPCFSGSAPQPPPRLHPHTMLSAGASAGPASGLSLFRGGSLTHGEPRVLATVSGQYNGAGGGGASASMGPYSPLFSVHGQSSPLATVSPYTGFFSQYPANASPYSPASLMASARLPPIESYSAVLASMGTHLQHAGPQGQAPSGGRAAYLPLGQYSHRSLSATTSPGPSAHSPSSAATSFSLRDRDSLLPRSRGERDHSPPRHGSAMTSDLLPEDKKLLASSTLLYPRHGSPGNVLKEVKSEPRDAHQKVPSGKEGSLKHRILTSDLALGSPAPYGPVVKARSQSLKTEEEAPSGKRARYMAPTSGASSLSSSSSPPTDPHVFVTPHAVGPPSGGPYPQQQHTPASLPARKASPSPFTSSPSTTSPSSASHHPHLPECGVSQQEGTRGGGGGGRGGGGGPPALHYPPHFLKGSIIQLANGDLKRVEDLHTEDFVSSAEVSPDLQVDSSTVVRILLHPHSGTATLGFSVGQHRVQVTVEATLEHPFFVFGRGWSSCSPEHTLQRYQLDCHRLSVGDVCISLTHKDVTLKAAEIVNQQQQQQQQQGESPVTSEETRKPFLEHDDRSLKQSPGHKDVGPDIGQPQDSSMNENNSDQARSRGENDSAVDLTHVHKSSQDCSSSSHNPDTDRHVTSQASPAQGFPASETPPSKTRMWSSQEAEAMGDHVEGVKSNADTNQ